ncbi:hypothetical protein BDZ91DRAFT_851825 [Kalaharituber pfeilii]|nr:hypothetical protein BDZ91DRAFT_851825 [Kalaharituber pfeilii]
MSEDKPAEAKSDEFDFAMFRGGFFTIVLADADEVATPAGVTSEATSSTSEEAAKKAVPAVPEFWIHKSLLASVSPELAKHTNNDMKEGREGKMVLHDVDRTTLERFLQWAYKRHYTVEGLPRVMALLTHTKIYVFAERFNIQGLKDESYTKATQSLQLMDGYPRPDDEELAELADVFEYAFDNLPVDKDKLLEFYAQYIAWALELLRTKEDFRSLLANHRDIAAVVLNMVRRRSVPPWKQQQQHPLLRYCSVCLTSQIAMICCAGCHKKFGGNSAFVSGNRELYKVCCKPNGATEPCCGKGVGEYSMHEYLVCPTAACATASNNLSFPD